MGKNFCPSCGESLGNSALVCTACGSTSKFGLDGPEPEAPADTGTGSSWVAKPGAPRTRSLAGVKNKNAQTSLTLGIAGFIIGGFLGFFAIYFGMRALKQIQETGEGGGDRANIGIALGVVQVLIFVVAVVRLF